MKQDERDDNPQQPAYWERQLVQKLVFEQQAENRRARRWSNFFKLAMLAYLIVILLLMNKDWFDFSADKLTKKKHTAVVDLNGLIAEGKAANADDVVAGLRDAFEDDNTKGVILRANSPGGSPVQSSLINKEITRLREKYPDTPIYATVGDMCASGCYYIISAVDKIYVDESSLVGSIGVRMDGFGFVDAMKKLGVERRLLTAGEHKGILDPFQPEREDEKQFVEKMLAEVHQQFIDVVKAGRGDRLADDPDLFSGLFWVGRKSIELGLADEIGSAGTVARDVIKAEKVVDFTQKEDLFSRLADRIGASIATTLMQLGSSGGNRVMR